MSTSETITRTDLTNILNEVLPFSFTEFRHQTGTATVPNNTLTQAHSETFASGSWLILTTTETTSGGSGTANLGQNRISKDGSLVSAVKGLADLSITIPNFYVLQSANNTTIRLDIYQTTGNSQSQIWKFIAIRIGDKFAQGEADYIVEQGTSGIWTYRKWNSGIAECWGTYTDNRTSTQFTSTGNIFYRTVADLGLPPSLFTSAPTVNLTTNFANAGAVSLYDITASSISFSEVSAVNTARTVYVQIDAKGTWK